MKNNFINSIIYLLDIFIYKLKLLNLLNKTNYNKYAIYYNNIFIKYPQDNYFKLFNIYTVKVKEYLIYLD
jgi:hypothetical protein